ncbi:hypothetical protein [Bdellovibrio sp. HCB209]|uniref:hypothetical protein n=1 Tax=Bdellovibrio sp. HCB209 TaxID=3394354 RepID=UPI0039B3B8CC
MKFNESNKKWAMTGVLLAALSFNISPPTFVKTFSMDMASTKEVKMDKITNASGVYQVTYTALDRDKTSLKYSKVDTESGTVITCDDCITEFVINKPLSTQIDVLNVTAAKLIAKYGEDDSSAEVEDSASIARSVIDEMTDHAPERVKAPRKEVAKKSKDKKDPKAKFAKMTAALDSLASECVDMDSSDEKMSCYSEGLSAMFSDLDSDEINDGAVNSFINRRVMPIQADLILENRSKYYQYLRGTGEAPESISQKLAYLEDFIIRIPEGHEKLQQALINSTASIKAADLKFINSLKEKAAASSGVEKTEIQNEIGWRIQSNPTLDTELLQMSQRISQITAETSANSRMAQSNRFAAGLQEAINQAFMSVGSNSSVGQTAVVDANGQTWVRADVAGRGYSQTGTTFNPGTVVVPNGIPTTNQNFMAPIVPTGVAAVNNTAMPVVPQSIVQPQVQPQMFGQQQVYQPGFTQPQTYTQPQMMYSQPQMNQQFGANQPGVINMNTVGNGNQGAAVINMRN